MERRAYLIVNQSPLLQKGVNAHDSANITSQIPSASRDSQILDGVKTICVDHEITIVLVDGRCFASVSVVEEFGHGLALDFVDNIHIEPGAVAR